MPHVPKVLLHELAHNRFDDHDDDFKARRSALAPALAQTSPTSPSASPSPSPSPSPNPNGSPNPDVSSRPKPRPHTDRQALDSELGREYRAHRDAHRGARAVSDHAVAAATPQEGDDPNPNIKP